MALSHALLGLLSMEPATGYELAKRFEHSLAHVWYAGHSQIYPELAKLESAGFIAVVAEGARRSKTWDITESGRELLHFWLTDSEPNRHIRNEVALIIFLIPLLNPKDALAILDREGQQLQRQQHELREIARQMDGTSERHPFREAVELGLRTTETTLKWLSDYKDRLHSA